MNEIVLNVIGILACIGAVFVAWKSTRKKGPAVYHEPMPWKDEYWENRP